MKLSRFGIVIAVVSLGSSMGLAQPAPAPQPAPEPAPRSSTADPKAADVSDEKLRQFATAAAGVQQIQEEYAKKAQSLQKTTEQRIVSSVEEAGMTVEEFTRLVALVQSDPELMQRLDDLQGQ